MARGWLPANNWMVLDAIAKESFELKWTFDEENRRIDSPFGFVQDRVQLKADGSTPDFDRMVYGEAPNINAVVYGYRRGSRIPYVAVTVQARPFSDNPDGTPADPPIVFGQPCVMGFNLERVAGKDAAIREASEEAGTGTAILRAESLGHHNPNPTFCATWSELFAIEVDMDKIDEGKTDHSELIYRAEYVRLDHLLGRIRTGTHQGVNYRSATANDALFVWIADRPSVMDFRPLKED